MKNNFEAGSFDKMENPEEWLLTFVQQSGNHHTVFEERTALSYACIWGDIILLRKLLLWPGNINCINPDGSTALTLAPNSEFTRLLIELGAKVSVEKPEDGLTSLHRAAERGLTDQIFLLMKDSDGSQKLESFDYLLRTPLGCAAYNGREDSVRLLLSLGAKVDSRSKDYAGDSVLQFALHKGYGTIARILIESGARFSDCFGNSFTPAFLAKRAGLESQFKELIE